MTQYTGDPESARATLAVILQKINGAYAPSTIRAYRADFLDFIAFCESNREVALPGSPSAVADFVAVLMQRGKRSASIRRAIAGIASIHGFSGHVDPTKHLDAKLAIRRMHRQIGRYHHQALGITKEVLDRMAAATDDSLRGARDRALLLFAYDTLCRRMELHSLRVEDIRRKTIDPTLGIYATTVYLRKSKTDQEAEGHWLPLTAPTAAALNRWLEKSGLKSGPLFRGVTRSDKLTSHIDPGQISRIYKRLAKRAAFSSSIVREISGHSTRVGAAQDLLLSGASLPVIMSRGRWSKADTVMRYVEMAGNTW